ncbi:Glomulin [Labeo rohita]|uniref:Glomulin n=1 Tax=Labeo rohita TaxID=84645 RepID=A0ABQ8MYB2_LABRO|nr:Glomulin [Labeo rohita]
MALEQLCDVVQRCQAVKDESFSPEDYDLFFTAGRTCIEQGSSAQVLSILVDEKNQNIVRFMGWNLLGPLVQILLKKEDRNLPHCHAILSHLLEVGSPKELLVGLLEQVEEADSASIAETVTLLLKPLQTVLLRLGMKKASSVGMTLSTLLSQVARLPVPVTKEQEEDDVFGLCRCCSALIQFVKPFVEEIKEEIKDNNRISKDNELRVELLKFRSVLKRREVPGFLEEEVRYPKESLACLSHLLFVDYIAVDIFPAVLSPVFVLQCNMEYIELLLSRTEESRLQKGLELYEKSLIRVEDNSLPVDLLELKTFFSVPQNLVKVMTLCPDQTLRTKGLKVFQLSIDKFNTEAKYKFFNHHAGVEGYIIKNIKNQIDCSLKPCNGNDWFLGKHLLPLLRLVLCLPHGPETDLLQNLDKIMESLNLLRYMLIRDKEWENEVSSFHFLMTIQRIWTELYKIEDSYLKPLRTGLNMSKAHYEAELKNSKASVCTVTVDNEELPNMTPEMQIQVLQSAIFTFDLMESVLARIEEIIEAKERPLS